MSLVCVCVCFKYIFIAGCQWLWESGGYFDSSSLTPLLKYCYLKKQYYVVDSSWEHQPSANKKKSLVFLISKVFWSLFNSLAVFWFHFNSLSLPRDVSWIDWDLDLLEWDFLLKHSKLPSFLKDNGIFHILWIKDN